MVPIGVGWPYGYAASYGYNALSLFGGSPGYELVLLNPLGQGNSVNLSCYTQTHNPNYSGPFGTNFASARFGLQVNTPRATFASTTCTLYQSGTTNQWHGGGYYIAL